MRPIRSHARREAIDSVLRSRGMRCHSDRSAALCSASATRPACSIWPAAWPTLQHRADLHRRHAQDAGRRRPGGARRGRRDRLPRNARRPRQDAAPAHPRRHPRRARQPRARRRPRNSTASASSTLSSAICIPSRRPSPGPAQRTRRSSRTSTSAAPRWSAPAPRIITTWPSSPTPASTRPCWRKCSSNQGRSTLETRERLAAAAFARIAAYDQAVAAYFARRRPRRRLAGRARPALGQAPRPPLRREPAPEGRLLRRSRLPPRLRRHGRGAARQGTVVQQHSRSG